MATLKWEIASTRQMRGVGGARVSTDGRFLLTKGYGDAGSWTGYDNETRRHVTGISPDKYGELRALMIACEELAS